MTMRDNWRKCNRSNCLLGPAAVLAVVAMVAEGSAAGRVEKQRQAERLVHQALAHESLGLTEQRDRLLAEASAKAPDYAPANWHQGRIRIGKDWLSVDRPCETENQRKLRESYQRRREEASDTVADQLALADWCASHRMTPQETAHLHRVVQIEPNHLVARNRLNERQVNGRWVSESDLWQGLQDRQRLQASIEKWRDRLLRAAESLTDRGRRHEAIRNKLLDEIVPEAIPAVEAVLAAHSEAGGMWAVEILAQMPSHEACHSLVRIAVLSPWAEVRVQAAERLTSRPYDHYVPLLLSELSAPIESRVEAALVNGQILYRHQFEQELQDRRQVAVLDTALLRRPSLVETAWGEGPVAASVVSLPSIGAAEAQTRTRVLLDMQQVIVAREQQRLQRNLWIYTMNERIGQVLSTATGEDLAPTPQAWWSWWDEINGVRMEGEKFTDIRHNTDVQIYEDVAPVIATGNNGGASSSPAPRRADCFVAGTPVWTIAGLQSIEQIRIGDLVLSQDVQTGELAYKPVLQTNVRSAEPLIRVTLATLGREILEGSGGHPLWVAGDGWTMLRELEPGAILHGIGGSAMASEVGAGEDAETYNLVVADFHTYVVGHAKIVCHDNTPRRPTNAVVPGLVPR
ncbi:MAG: hypothetical protein KJ000_06155 [Pirellulaceae bacterium]|nr:hypothetical protein [Pirellulaceae bacterium]